MRYIIARHAGLDGVRLSKPGHWGNMPYPSDEAAVAAARRDAGRLPVEIERTSRTLRSPSL